MKTPAATWLWLPLVQVWLSAFALAAPAPGPVFKEHSAFFPPERLTRIRQNLARHPEGERLRRQALERAAWWLEQSDDTLWSLMFGPSISRSWMVWSNGDCPSCKRGVPMYTWEINARQHPWKVRCPHCREFFPKNDFGAYYRSGLNREGLFDPARGPTAPSFSTPNIPARTILSEVLAWMTARGMSPATAAGVSSAPTLFMASSSNSSATASRPWPPPGC
ncbi:MAG TPA: hypothetical protein P5233_04255 [Candidatus Paceibacterota bacterium]|nr:hypothetical protein [Candidatus Paceibacterota bacterium]